MLRMYSFLLFSLAFGSSFLLKITPLPVSLVGFAIACVIVSIMLTTLMFIRTTGTAVGIAGLLLVYHAAPTHPPVLTGLLVFQIGMLLAATGLLIAADISTAKENSLNEV